MFKRSTRKRFRATLGSQTRSVVTNKLMKTLYWLKPMSERSSLVNTPQQWRLFQSVWGGQRTNSLFFLSSLRQNMVCCESRTGGKSALARQQEQSLSYLIQLRRSWRHHGFTETNSNWSVCLLILSSSISSGELLWMDQLSRTPRICRLVKCGSLFLLCKKR